MTQALKVSTQNSLLEFFKKCFKGNEKEAEALSKEAIKLTQLVFEELKASNQANADELERQAVANVKGELATKDFVGKEIAELRTELKQDIAEVRTEIANLRDELKTLMVKSAVFLAITIIGGIWAIFTFVVDK